MNFSETLCMLLNMQKERTDSDTLMMSEELKGQIPDLSEDDDVNNSFIIVVIDLQCNESRQPLVGSLVGIKHDVCTKIDMRSSMKTAYTVFSYITNGGKALCDSFQLQLGDQEVTFTGPYELLSPAIIDVDSTNKMCTLAVDLVKMSSTR